MIFHPLGYPVEIISDAAALQAAKELWGDWPVLFEAPLVSIGVRGHGGVARVSGVGSRKDRKGSKGREEEALPSSRALRNLSPVRPPRFTAAAGLLRFESDSRNFAVFDMEKRAGVIHSEDVPPLLETLVLTALDAVFFTPLHAACVSRAGVGTLLCGASGAGKSSLAYACVRRGWTLVSDDAVHLAPGLDRLGVGASQILRLREPGAAPTAEQTIRIDAAAEGFATARTAAIGRCVFLRRRPGPVAWRRFPTDAAIEYFLQYLRPRDTESARRRLSEFLHSPLLLEYENAEEAAAAL